MELFQELKKSFTKIQRSFTPESLEEFLHTPYDELSRCHFGIGIWIRNCLLTEKSKLWCCFMDGGVYDLDDMSDFVIKAFYIYIKIKNRSNQL